MSALLAMRARPEGRPWRAIACRLDRHSLAPTKASAQLTDEVQQKLGTSCVVALEKTSAAVDRDRLSEAADTGSSISVEGSNGSATLKGLNDARIGLIKSHSNWLIESGYKLGGAS